MSTGKPPQASKETMDAVLQATTGPKSEARLRGAGLPLAAAARRLGPALRAARSILGDDEEARDAVQDALLRLLERGGGFRGDARMDTYLYRAVVNQCIGLLRRRRVRRFFVSIVSREPVREAPSAETLAAEARAVAALRAAVDRLAPAQRVAFVLRHVEGLGIAETAAAMNVGEATVKTHLSRALEKLRTLLAAHRDRRGER